MNSKNDDSLYETHRLLEEAGFDGLAEVWDLESARVTAEKVVKDSGLKREVEAAVEMKQGESPERIYKVLNSGKGKSGYENGPDPTEFISEAIWRGMEDRVKELLMPAEDVV